MLGPDEQPEGGPALGPHATAWPTTTRSDFLLPAWDGFVGTIPAGRRPRPGDRRPGKCLNWERAGFDPGWAGVLAEAFLATPDPRPPLPHRTRPDLNLLPLIEDAVSLLPIERRWVA